MTNLTPVEALQALKDGESWIWPESDYGRAEIFIHRGVYLVYEIPQYGGVPRFSFATESIPAVIKEVESWT